MSIFANLLATEKRATFTSNMTGNWLSRLFGETESGNESGIRVTPDNSWKYSAFYGAVDLIARGIAQLPLQLFKWKKDYTREPARGHPVYALIGRRPNREQTAYCWRHAMQAWVLTWGNAYAEIERNASGRPVALWPMHPRHVSVVRDEATGELIYEYRNAGETVRVPYMDMLHIRTAGDGLVGLSPVSLFAQSIGLGMAAETAGAALFKNGMRTGGVLQHPGVLKEPAKKNLKSSMDSAYAGSENTGKTMLLEEGMKWIQNTIPPDDAQYIETRVRQLRDIACIFHVPPHKLADLADATFANVEEQNIEWVTDCLDPWFVNWEQEIDFKLLTPSEQAGYYSKFNANALLRGNADARASFYTKMFGIGMSINDIMRLEDKNPIGELGDARFVPANMVTLERAVEGPPVDPIPQGPGTQPGGEPAGDGTREMLIAAHRAVLDDVCGRVARMNVRSAERGSIDIPNDQKKRCADMLTPSVYALRVSLGLCEGLNDIGGYISALVEGHTAKVTTERITSDWRALERRAANELTERIISDAEKDYAKN